MEPAQVCDLSFWSDCKWEPLANHHILGTDGQAENPFTATSSKMKPLISTTPHQAYFRWPILAQTQTALSFSSQPYPLPIWMASMSSSVKCCGEWVQSKKSRQQTKTHRTRWAFGCALVRCVIGKGRGENYIQLPPQLFS